jgi:hypothetical protein
MLDDRPKIRRINENEDGLFEGDDPGDGGRYSPGVNPPIPSNSIITSKFDHPAALQHPEESSDGGFVTLIEAPMGGGKTCTSTAFVVDDYYRRIYGIESPGIRSKTWKVKPYKLDFVKLAEEDDRIIHIPANFRTYSESKIFTNYHLYGIKHMFAPMEKVLEWMNTPIMLNAKWVIDEGWLSADSRRGMNPLTVIITQYAQLMRKLGIELFWLTQHSRFLDWRIRYITKRKIFTDLDKKTWICKLLVQNLYKGTEKTIHYYAPTYWRFYNTYEVPPMPKMMIGKAKNWA